MMNSRDYGFALPFILTVSLAVIGLSIVLLQNASVLHSDAYENYRVRLTQEAAEAGIVHAQSCLGRTEKHTQTWKDNQPLMPDTDCFGKRSKFPNNYVYNDGGFRTWYKVGKLLDPSNDMSLGISVTGYGERLSGGKVTKQYKQILMKTIRWPEDLVASKTVSGSWRVCGLLSGKVFCWGKNHHGQLGNGKTLDFDHYEKVPVRVLREPDALENKKVIDLSAMNYHNCAISEDYQAYCWGMNDHGQLGNGTKVDSSVPVKVRGFDGKQVTSIGGGRDTTCAVADGKIYCWGENAYGMIGNGDTAHIDYLMPELVRGTDDPKGLPKGYKVDMVTASALSQTVCTLYQKRAYCWGSNNGGQLGIGSYNEQDIQAYPVRIDGGDMAGKDVVSIAVDGYKYKDNQGDTPPHTCAVAEEKVYCWGDNRWGQLGIKVYDTTPRNVPTRVDTSGVLKNKKITHVAAGVQHTCVLASDERAYCWGRNQTGQVGNNMRGDIYPRFTHPQAVVMPDIIKDVKFQTLFAGANRACVTGNNGRTYCWGYNNAGQIGDNSTQDRYVPTESLYLRPSNIEYMF